MALLGPTSACGGADGAPPRGGSERRAPIETSVLALDGTALSFAQLRGRPVLVFFFATFDGASQAALTPLEQVVVRHPELEVVGVAIQPNARRLAEAWQAALDPPFLVTWDPEETITGGTSDFGRIEGVPLFVALRTDGTVAGRLVGLPTVAALEALVAAVSPGG